MKKIKFSVANLGKVEDRIISTTSDTVEEIKKMVDPNFVENIQKVFKRIPMWTVLRFPKDAQGLLKISLEPTYQTGMKHVLEGYGDADLVSYIFSIATDVSDKYEASDHEVDSSTNDEDIRIELLKQFLENGMDGKISDWTNSYGVAFKRISYVLPRNLEVRFCLEATDELNNLLDIACTPEFMRGDSKNNEQETA